MNALYLPLAGVIVGWALNEISAVIRDRTADKKAIGLALTRVLRLEAQMVTLATVLETMKDLSRTWEAYETIRQRCADRYIETETQLAEQAKEAVPIVAACLPIQAMQLEGLYNRHAFTKKIDFSNASANRDIYVRLISAVEAADEIGASELRKLAVMLARRHSLLTLFRVWRQFQKRTRSLVASRDLIEREFVEPYLASSGSGMKPDDRERFSS
jgi:hypothetical protein